MGSKTHIGLPSDLPEMPRSSPRKLVSGDSRSKNSRTAFSTERSTSVAMSRMLLLAVTTSGMRSRTIFVARVTASIATGRAAAGSSNWFAPFPQCVNNLLKDAEQARFAIATFYDEGR
jgi:hypothetical protein